MVHGRQDAVWGRGKAARARESRSTAARAGHTRVPRRPATRIPVEGRVPWLSARLRSRDHRPHPPGRRRRAEPLEPRVCTAAGVRTDLGGKGTLHRRRGSQSQRKLPPRPGPQGPPSFRRRRRLAARPQAPSQPNRTELL